MSINTVVGICPDLGQYILLVTDVLGGSTSGGVLKRIVQQRAVRPEDSRSIFRIPATDLTTLTTTTTLQRAGLTVALTKMIVSLTRNCVENDDGYQQRIGDWRLDR